MHGLGAIQNMAYIISERSRISNLKRKNPVGFDNSPDIGVIAAGLGKKLG